MRHSYLDNAAILTGQISGIAPTPPVRGKTVKTRIAGLKTQDDFKQKLCVPLIEMNVESYRRRAALETRKRGRPATRATEKNTAVD